jgi:hypothetical protein
MKKFKFLALAIFAVVALTISSCSPDDTPAEPSFTVTEVNYTILGAASDAELNAIVTVKNTSDEEITLYWVRQNVTVPTGWATAICDHNLCYPENVAEHDLILTAGQEIELKGVFYPNNVDGTGSYDLLIYDTVDRANTEATYSFSATARP